MAQIYVSVLNDTSDNQNVHVFDQFANGKREVGGSPFALASKDQSPPFMVNADDGGKGQIEYRCDGGPTNSYIDVHDGDVVKVD
jgi:hypothetical protein